MQWAPRAALTLATLILLLYIFTSDTATVTLTTAAVPVLEPHGHDARQDTVADEGHGIEVISPVVVPERDLWVTGMDFEIENASPSVLHHAMLTTANTPLTWCSNTYDRRNYMIFTEDQMRDPDVHFPEGYALFIPAGTPLILYSMFHNLEAPLGPGETFRDVSARLTLRTAEPSEHKPFTKLAFYSPHVADDPCKPTDEGYFFTVPARTPEYRKSTTVGAVHPERLVFDHPTRIVYWGAHLHGWQGGKSLIARKAGSVIGEFATVNASDVPFLYDTPFGPTDIRVESGEPLTVEAVYSNPSDDPLLGAMGILYLFIAHE